MEKETIKPNDAMKEEIKEAHCFEYFHGEELYKCPWCLGVFDYYDALFEKDCVRVPNRVPNYEGEVYRHKACGKLLHIS